MMRDFHLILFVLVLVLVDVVFITFWIFYDSLKPEDILFENSVRLRKKSRVLCLSLLKMDHYYRLFHYFYFVSS